MGLVHFGIGDKGCKQDGSSLMELAFCWIDYGQLYVNHIIGAEDKRSPMGGSYR